jgi:hypothetical protein
VNCPGAHTLEPAFLQPEVVDRPLERRVGHEGEVGGSVAEVLVEAGGEGGEEELVANLEPKVLELVGDGLEAQAVGVQGLIALGCAEEFLLQKDNTLELVIGEEAVDLSPHRAGIIAFPNDGLEDVRRDGEEEPADDGGVDGQPVGVAGEEVGGAVDVIAQVVLAEEEV